MSSPTPTIENLLASAGGETTADVATDSPAARRTAAVIAVWGFIAMAGIAWLMAYHLTPTAGANDQLASTNAVASGTADLAPGQSSLVMLVHPLCPCSRASLNELAAIAERWPGRLAVKVIFTEPALLDTDPAATTLWTIASTIPNATLVKDADGALARRFGAKSSGQTFLYDALGNLRFSGGITPSRGEVGQNAGSTAIDAALKTGPLAPTAAFGPVTAPVFGCSLE